MHLQQTLEKYIPLIHNMLVPTAIFACALISFLLKGSLSNESALFYHWGFYTISFVCFILMLNFNRSRLLFFMIITTLSYVLINYIKNRFGTDFQNDINYQNLCVFLPFNLLFFYLIKSSRFISRTSLLFLVLVSLEYSIAEFLGRFGLSLEYKLYNINLFTCSGFSLLCIIVFIKSVRYGRFFDYCILFASFSLCAALIFSTQASGLSLFFFVTQLLLAIYIIFTLIHNHFYDDATGFYNRNSYIIQSKHFPLKYSLGIISIDNYENLRKTIGMRAQKVINKLIAETIQEMVVEGTIYRYAPDQFVVMYKKLDRKEAFQHLDNIRRQIAGLAYEYHPRKKPLKLTVSCSVAEKKRSDISAIEVLMRADKEMRKTLKFSHNVTSMG